MCTCCNCDAAKNSTSVLISLLLCARVGWRQMVITPVQCCSCHYNDVIMVRIASQITSIMIVYSHAYSGADQREHQSSTSLAFVRGIHRDRWIPRTNGSNAENVSIWWRHHGIEVYFVIFVMKCLTCKNHWRYLTSNRNLTIPNSCCVSC